MIELLVWSAPLVLGALFTAAAVIVSAPVLKMRQSWSKAIGTVVDIEEFESGGETVRRVEVRFRGAAERDWTASCPVFRSAEGYPKGTDVPILFDPRNPTSVRIDNFMELWLLPTIVSGVGALAFLIGLCLAISLA